MKIFTLEEVKNHNTKEDCFIIINNNVYDMSNFNHPGGSIIFTYAGKDATEIFHEMHNKKVLRKYKGKIVGTLQTSKL